MSIAELKAKVDRLTPEERRELLAYIDHKDSTGEKAPSKEPKKHLESSPDLQSHLRHLDSESVGGKSASNLVSEGSGE